MNIGQFFEQHRGTRIAQELARLQALAPRRIDGMADVFSNTEYMIAEMASAADTIRALTGEIEAARSLRQIGPMREATAELYKKLGQLKIMAESLQKVAGGVR